MAINFCIYVKWLNFQLLHVTSTCTRTAPPARYPGTPQAAVFDTSWHSSMPETAFLYGVPLAWHREHGVRRSPPPGHLTLSISHPLLLITSPLHPLVRSPSHPLPLITSSPHLILMSTSPLIPSFSSPHPPPQTVIPG